MRWTKYFWDLPNELILDILSFDLSLSDLQHLRLQSRRFQVHVDATLKLLYRREAKAAAVVDDPTSNASLMERIARLRRWETDFRNFNGYEIDIDTLSHVNRPGGGISGDDIVDINRGFLLMSSPTRTYNHRPGTGGIFYVRLPSVHHLESVAWQRVPFTRDPKEFIGAFRLVAELDLLAIVTFRESSPEDTYNLTLHLRTFSTAHAHPWASRPSIKWAAGDAVPNLQSELHVKLLVVGDNVGLLLTMRSEIHSQFLVFNWKTGRQQMLASPTNTTGYEDFCFLSEDVVLFTAPSQNRLHLCSIVESFHDQPQVSAGLHLFLPKLNEDAQTILRAIDCNTSPLDNRTTVAMPNAHPLYLPPFQPSSRDSIIVFNLTYDLSGPLMIPDYAAFRLVVHRQALLDLLAFSVTERSDAGPQRLAWSDWGPVRTRWFAATEDQDTFLQVMSGQRYVSVAQNEYGDNFPITLYDFNPKNIPGSDYAVTYRDRTEYVEPYRSHDIQPFGEEVWSELPYIEQEWVTNYGGMEHAIMDDERIIFLPIFDTSDDSEDDSGDLDIEQDIVLKGDTLSIRVVVMG